MAFESDEGGVGNTLRPFFMSLKQGKTLEQLTSTTFFFFYLGMFVRWDRISSIKNGCRRSSVDSSVPSILTPGFESQAHHLRFYQLNLN